MPAQALPQNATRLRLTIGPQTRPVLPPHVRLQRDEVRGRWVVLAPEKVLWPDEVSVDILLKCTGASTVSAISQELAESYAAPVEEVEADVLEFLQEWSDRLLIRQEVRTS